MLPPPRQPAAAAAAYGDDDLAVRAARDPLRQAGLTLQDAAHDAAGIAWGDLTLGALVGGGAFGQVFRAAWLGTPVAVKLLKNVGIDDAAAEVAAAGPDSRALAEFASEVLVQRIPSPRPLPLLENICVANYTLFHNLFVVCCIRLLVLTSFCIDALLDSLSLFDDSLATHF
jgi:hypothetical protein